MNRQSFIDLTALLDVVLILFFAALINLAGKADVNQQLAHDMQLKAASLSATNQQLAAQNADLRAGNLLMRQQLADLYGAERDRVEDYQTILNRISIVEVALRGDDNQLVINEQASSIYIVRDSFLSQTRRQQLDQKVRNALNGAIDKRQKGDIIYLKVTVSDREVYKYAVDYLMNQVNAVVEQYGRDKVILSTWYH